VQALIVEIGHQAEVGFHEHQDPAKVIQTFGKMTDDRRYIGQPASLRPQILARRLSSPPKASALFYRAALPTGSAEEMRSSA
jgi:hypothetical protein